MSGGVEALVAEHPFAAGLSADDVTAICRNAALIEVPAGTLLFTEGERSDKCYLVFTGIVGLELYLHERGTATVATVGPGEILGWSWLMPPHRWRFDAVARTDVAAVALDAATVLAACEGDPRLDRVINRRIALTLASRLEAARHQLLDVYSDGGEVR